MEKPAKEKLKYSFFNNLKYMLGVMWRLDRRATLLGLSRAPILAAKPLLGLLLTSTIVSLASGGADMDRIVLSILLICGAIAACMVVRNVLDAQCLKIEFLSSLQYEWQIFDSLMAHDYEYNESPKGLSAARKAMDNCGGDTSGARRAIKVLSGFLANAMGLISYAAVIFTLHPLILLAICATSAASYFIMRRTTAWNHKNKDQWLPIDRKRDYLQLNSKDIAPAKDIRLYGMAGWFRALFADVLQKRMDWARKEETYGLGIDTLCAVLSLLREGVAYGLLIWAVFQRSMSAADFVLYFGMIGGFSSWFDGIVGNFYWFDRMNTGFNEMRSYFDYENKSNRGSGLPVPREAFSIEFQNVSYRFTDNDHEIIADLSLTIPKGEKFAIVGLNGAGKTTLVKLMCGLYRPTKGIILANGRPIDDYNIDEYFSLFSAVFQDITILPMTVRQNIACKPENIDEVRLAEALRKSGFGEKSGSLPDGADTHLVRGMTPGAVDLSGGETQKLALARALYKDAPFLILDEPTASLDPIAESQIYQQYGDIAGGKTSVFISHRLASTRFCDRILYIEDGRIAEDGSHDELMRRKGKYYELFEIQSHYYRDEGMSA